jgi:hypothetical protein
MHALLNPHLHIPYFFKCCVAMFAVWMQWLVPSQSRRRANPTLPSLPQSTHPCRFPPRRRAAQAKLDRLFDKGYLRRSEIDTVLLDDIESELGAACWWRAAAAQASCTRRGSWRHQRGGSAGRAAPFLVHAGAAQGQHAAPCVQSWLTRRRAALWTA